MSDQNTISNQSTDQSSLPDRVEMTSDEVIAAYAGGRRDFRNISIGDDDNDNDAHFDGANLRGADFSHSYLPHAHFDGANLSDCNFSHAYLYGVDFSSANLTNVNFTGADIGYISLYDTIMTGAILADLASLSASDHDLLAVLLELSAETAEQRALARYVRGHKSQCWGHYMRHSLAWSSDLRLWVVYTLGQHSALRVMLSDFHIATSEEISGPPSYLERREGKDGYQLTMDAARITGEANLWRVPVSYVMQYNNAKPQLERIMEARADTPEQAMEEVREEMITTVMAERGIDDRSMIEGYVAERYVIGRPVAAVGHASTWGVELEADDTADDGDPRLLP